MISNSTAYQWLLAMLRREALVDFEKPNIMESIRQRVVSYLPRSPKISRKTPVEVYGMTFLIDWDLIAFLKEQEYQEQPNHALESAIIITGGTTDAQTLTCAQYLHQTWPLSGEHILRLLKDLVNSTSGYSDERKC